MSKNIVEKIFEEHLVSGKLEPGSPISLKIDQTLTQDATGTMAYLQFEAIGLDKIKIPLAVSYVDHNTLQTDYRNADDHAFLQSAAARYGLYFSRPGNGICHQVNLERFSVPGNILLGSDSHTPTAGGVGMIGIGVGGLDIAVTMAGIPFELIMPEVVLVKLKGKLNRPGVGAMDVILELLRNLTVKGGVGRIFEYSGDGLKDLSVPERATMTNMGAELGATSSVFPGDKITREYLVAQDREKDYKELKADEGAQYTRVIEIDLNSLEPLIAQPHSPDNVVKVKDIAGKPVDQVCVGSCTNSSYNALKTIGLILRKRKINNKVSMTLSAGSRQVYETIAQDGTLKDILASGVRVLESACGPCIGMGQAPVTDSVTLRTFNRNFKGRSGTLSAGIYLTSPVTAVVSAIEGKITDPGSVDYLQGITAGEGDLLINDNMIIPPIADNTDIELIKGPNIKNVPVNEPLKDKLILKIVLKAGDNITTDDIMPAGAKVLPLRSNIPEISKHVFSGLDSGFYDRAMDIKKDIENDSRLGGVIVGGENYGQGSSREHAAIAPMYLGIKVVIAKSFARIHKKNLINFGVLPLVFKDSKDCDKFKQDFGIKNLGNKIIFENVIKSLENNDDLEVTAEIQTGAEGRQVVSTEKIGLTYDLTDKEKQILFAGGLLPYIKKTANS